MRPKLEWVPDVIRKNASEVCELAGLALGTVTELPEPWDYHPRQKWTPDLHDPNQYGWKAYVITQAYDHVHFDGKDEAKAFVESEIAKRLILAGIEVEKTDVA